MPNISISMTPKTTEMKAQMAKAVTEQMSRISGIPSEHFVIMFNELPKENVAVGGVLLSQFDKD